MNKLYLLLITGFAFFQYSCGQNQTPVTKQEVNVTDSARKTQSLDSLRYIPKAVGWTNDFAHLFSKKETESLDSLIGTYEKRTTVEFAVATIDSSMLGPIDFEPYTLLMFRTWGVGKKEKNNGILIVIAPGLRRIRIQNGYGIETILTDEQTKAIIDNTILPYFKEGKFYEGTKEGILAIIKQLKKGGL